MSEVFGPVNSTFSRFCIHRAESPIVAASGCPSTSFSPAPSAAVSLFRASKILRLGLSNAQEADRVFVNGNIYTVDEAFSTASAIAIQDGRFIYVGSDAGAQAHIGSETFVSDLEGKTVIPGLHDAHIHIRFGERELYPRIPDIRAAIGEWASVERMQEVIKRSLATGEGMRAGPEPRWLVLRGWMSDVWDPPVFRKELIDAVAPDHPVYIIRYTHGSAANSKALELAGITRATADPEGGHINPNRKIFEARKRETAALGAGEKLVLGHPLAATIGDSARCMQEPELVWWTGTVFTIFAPR